MRKAKASVKDCNLCVTAWLSPDKAAPGLDLYWIPLGAGRHVVRVSGKIYEALAAAVQRRPKAPLARSGSAGSGSSAMRSGGGVTA
jgi:hypothetical protein